MEQDLTADSGHLTDEGLENTVNDNLIDPKLCFVCQSDQPKYKCPACDARTCSVECCKKHKLFAACDGDTKRSRFIPMSKFDNLSILNDYRFLEDAERLRNNCKKEGQERRGCYFERDKKQMNRISKACARWQCKLQFLPPYFDRSRKNSSDYDPIADTIFWKLTWIFSDADQLYVETDRNPETVKLITFLKQILKPKQNSDFVNLSTKLKPYDSFEISDLKCFIKVDNNGWTKDRRFYELNINHTLRDNLKQKMLYEYPEIYVCIPETSGQTFNVLSEEVKNDTMSRRVWEKNPTATTFDEKIKIMQEAAKVISLPRMEKSDVTKGHDSTSGASFASLDSNVIELETPSSAPLKRLIPMKRQYNVTNAPQREKNNYPRKKYKEDDFKSQKSEMIRRLAEELSGSSRCHRMPEKFLEKQVEFIEEKEMVKSEVASKLNEQLSNNVQKSESKVQKVKTSFFGTLGDDSEISDCSD